MAQPTFLQAQRLNNFFWSIVTYPIGLDSYDKHVREKKFAPRGSSKYTKLKTMEPKKNPKFDIHRSRGVIFNISLAISLSLVITAFEWSVGTPKKELHKTADRRERIEMASIPIVYQKQKDLPAPQPLKVPETKPSLESINIKAVDNNKVVEESKTGVMDQNDSPMTEIPLASIDLPKKHLILYLW